MYFSQRVLVKKHWILSEAVALVNVANVAFVFMRVLEMSFRNVYM